MPTMNPNEWEIINPREIKPGYFLKFINTKQNSSYYQDLVIDVKYETDGVRLKFDHEKKFTGYIGYNDKRFVVKRKVK